MNPCQPCRHCEGRASMLAAKYTLWCRLWRTVPTRKCADYEREAGADDE